MKGAYETKKTKINIVGDLFSIIGIVYRISNFIILSISFKIKDKVSKIPKVLKI
jgi:hypothetical protein